MQHKLTQISVVNKLEKYHCSVSAFNSLHDFAICSLRAKINLNFNQVDLKL